MNYVEQNRPTGEQCWKMGTPLRQYISKSMQMEVSHSVVSIFKKNKFLQGSENRGGIPGVK